MARKVNKLYHQSGSVYQTALPHFVFWWVVGVGRREGGGRRWPRANTDIDAINTGTLSADAQYLRRTGWDQSIRRVVSTIMLVVQGIRMGAGTPAPMLRVGQGSTSTN